MSTDALAQKRGRSGGRNRARSVQAHGCSSPRGVSGCTDHSVRRTTFGRGSWERIAKRPKLVRETSPSKILLRTYPSTPSNVICAPTSPTRLVLRQPQTPRSRPPRSPPRVPPSFPPFLSSWRVSGAKARRSPRPRRHLTKHLLRDGPTPTSAPCRICSSRLQLVALSRCAGDAGPAPPLPARRHPAAAGRRKGCFRMPRW